MARRIALVLHQAGDDVDQSVQPAQAQAGIAPACGYGVTMLALPEAAERELLEAGQLADRQRVVAKLQQFGETDRRTLCRSFNDQSYARWEPVDGLVLALPDGKFSLAEQQLRRLFVV